MQTSEDTEIREYLDNEIRIYKFSAPMILIPFLILLAPPPTAIDPAWRTEVLFMTFLGSLFIAALVWIEINLFSRTGMIYKDYFSKVPKNYLTAILLILALRLIMFLVEVYAPDISITVNQIGYFAGFLVFITWALYLNRTQKKMISRLEFVKELSST